MGDSMILDAKEWFLEVKKRILKKGQKMNFDRISAMKLGFRYA